MKTFLIIITILLILSWLAYIPIWNNQVKKGNIKINTYKMIKVITGQLHID